MSFKHMYLTQLCITPIDVVLWASNNLCQLTKGLAPVKDNTRTTVDMLTDIFKNIGAKDKTEVDKQRARIGAAVIEQTQSDKAEKTGVLIET